MEITTSPDVPYVRYSSVQGYEGSDGQKVHDKDESEILVAPFSTIEISKGENTHVGSGKYVMTYDASISKGELQKISEEEDKQGMQYLVEHSKECSEQIEALLKGEFIEEEMDLQKQIFQMNMGIAEIRKGPISEYKAQWIKEDLEKIKQHEARIEELKVEWSKAHESVKKFKEIFKSVCMSRCKEIEQKIDLDYESQKAEFIRRKNDKGLQRKIEQKKLIVRRARNLHSKASVNSSKLDVILQHKQYVKYLSSMLDIPYFEYLKGTSELVASDKQVVAKLEQIDEPISEFERKNIDDISDQTLAETSELIESIHNDNPQYSTLNAVYRDKQNRAFLYAIYEKIMWHKSLQHYNELSMQLKKIQDRSTLDKVKDFFKGQARYKREMEKQIEQALPKIEKRRKELGQMPLKVGEVDPQMVLDELEQMKEVLSAGVINRYEEMRSFVVQNFDVDTSSRLSQIQNKSSEEQLLVAGHGNKKISASDKMKYFLESNGYEPQAEQEPSCGRNDKSDGLEHIQIDEVERLASASIQKNRRCVEHISRFEEKLSGKPEVQAEQTKGIGNGFHIVR